MNKRKKSFVFFLVLIFSIVSLYANYRILDYKIKVNVSEDYILEVKENYVFEFDTERHGFYRVIPYQNYLNHKIKVSDIKVDGGPFSSEKSGGFLTIKVGDPDLTVIGKVPYSISYTFDIGADVYEDFDEFYFNLVGTMWDCEIENASFEVVFPKPIDPKNVWLTKGSLNSTDVDNSSLNISSDNTIITGTVTALNSKEGVTLRCQMEDGYFVGARDYQTIIKVMAVVLILLNIILVLLAYIIFNRYGRDDKVIERSRFKAPNGFTPLSLDYFMNNAFSSTAYGASFIYWAHKGYIDIKENEDESVRLIRKVDFLIVKQDDDNDLDYKLFKAIFSGTEIGEEVDLEQLDSEALGVSLNKLNKAGELKFDSRLLKDQKASNMRVLIFLFAIISSGLSLLFTYISTSVFLPLTLVGSFFYIILATIILSSINSKWAIYKVGKRFATIFAILILTVVYFLANYINIYLLNIVQPFINLIISSVSSISMLLLILLFSLTEKRSLYAQTALEEFLGYQSFLNLVEVDQIELMIKDNPQFYFEHLCYAQVMGLTKTWEKKFAKIEIIQPSWYIVPYYGMYNFSRINNVSNRMNKSFNVPLAQYAKNHASKSGGPSSSGFSGSVGGGAGGGGGGAW
ncbi:MAG: DUF2207 domain-containing protein [Sphaerochaetaceae bacterium]|nr:DUF2207 domain-containing protein [Sphaerochaetaceae bacterium]MDC7250261.1 DUF2207 domain-containing protein [Sphaerochaetaceae bacterium]